MLWLPEGAGVFPAEGAGVLPAEGAGVLPTEGAGVLPAEGAGVLPAEGAGVLPAEGAGVLPAEGAGVLPALLIEEDVHTARAFLRLSLMFSYLAIFVLLQEHIVAFHNDLTIDFLRWFLNIVHRQQFLDL